MENWFCSLFKCSSVLPGRDKLLARVFGIFSEEIVRIWCRSEISKYENLGRPRIYNNKGKGYSLDFTLKSKDTGFSYVTEMKCWVEYQGYSFMTLNKASQLEELEGPAFNLFLDIAKRPNSHEVYVNDKKANVSGSILIWGNVEEIGSREVKSNYNIYDVLSIKSIIEDLVITNNTEYLSFIDVRRQWCEELFSKLTDLNRMQHLTTG